MRMHRNHVHVCRCDFINSNMLKLWLTPIYSTWLIRRSGTTILCSHQRRYNSVQTDHSWRGRVLELSGCAGCTCCAFNPACLLSEKAAAETRIEHYKRLSTSSAGWSPSLASGTCSCHSSSSASVSYSAAGGRIWPLAQHALIDHRMHAVVCCSCRLSRA